MKEEYLWKLEKETTWRELKVKELKRTTHEPSEIEVHGSEINKRYELKLLALSKLSDSKNI